MFATCGGEHMWTGVAQTKVRTWRMALGKRELGEYEELNFGQRVKGRV